MKRFLMTAATCIFASAAQAGTLEFQNVGTCTGGDIVTLTLQTTSTNCRLAPTPNNTTGLALSNGTSPSRMRADFRSLIEFVSVDLGDFGADADRIFLEAFNSNGVSLGRTSSTLTTNRGMRTLSLSATDISYAIFGTTFDAGFIAVDNLSYTVTDQNIVTTPVPLPAGGGLLLAGLGVFAALRRKR